MPRKKFRAIQRKKKRYHPPKGKEQASPTSTQGKPLVFLVSLVYWSVLVDILTELMSSGQAVSPVSSSDAATANSQAVDSNSTYLKRS